MNQYMAPVRRQTNDYQMTYMMIPRLEQQVFQFWFVFDFNHSFSEINAFNDGINSDLINQNITKVKMAKKLLVTLSLVLIQVCSISLTKHKIFSDECLYLPSGKLAEQSTFNFTIIKAWTPEQATQIESQALSASDFIRVQGWGPSKHQNKIYSIIKEKTSGIKDKLIFLKNLTKASDAPEFGLADQDIELGFGNPSKAIVAKIPQGKALLSFNCQAASFSQQVGQWSIIIGLADMKNLKVQHKNAAQRLRREIKIDHLTAREFLFNSNIQAPIVENSLFYTFKTSPAEGTFGLIKYECYVYAVKEGEEVILGPINKEMQDVFQMMDLVKDRTSCE